MRIDEALRSAAQTLKEGESPAVDAKVLLAYVLDKPVTYLFTWPEKQLSSSQQSRFFALVDRRLQGIPIAYLTGKRDFWSLVLTTSAHTLIPRPDTEVLVEQTLAHIRLCSFDSPLALCDLGTGTGAIALALASELPNARVTGVDVIPEAVALAQQNARLNNITNARFLQSSWFDALSNKRFHVIVSNPPYIEADSPFLALGDVRFEPVSALTSGKDGLKDIRHIVRYAPDYLYDKGILAFEHGFNQGEAVATLMRERGFIQVQTVKDYAQLDRVTLGYWNS
ncbi:peptide chain release factor N(5)-glutamine methyltransferase [Alteromonas profundi]|uniref:peptide chain release factor N(5)-glutamine methyltransferase n=1 Tax=Alteromonas profundi TaxID=2696062 RepID=UPI0031B58C47